MRGYSTSAALLAQLVEHLHGKEGVDGSSPSEGSSKSPASGRLLLPRLVAFRPTCSGMEHFLEHLDEEGSDLVVLTSKNRRFRPPACLGGVDGSSPSEGAPLKSP